MSKICPWSRVIRLVGLLGFGMVVGMLATSITLASMPVVIWMKASQWQVAPDHVSARVSGYKIRCDLISGSEVGFVRFSGRAWEEVPFKFVGDASTGSSKPWGYFSFGRWEWHDVRPHVPTEVMTTVQHECDGHVVATTIGPFTVPN